LLFVDGQTMDNGQWAITKAHFEHIVLRWAKTIKSDLKPCTKKMLYIKHVTYREGDIEVCVAPPGTCKVSRQIGTGTDVGHRTATRCGSTKPIAETTINS